VTEKTEKYKPMMQAVIVVSFHDVTMKKKPTRSPKIPYVTFKCHFNANKGTTQNET